jgi:hypothetical protein
MHQLEDIDSRPAEKPIMGFGFTFCLTVAFKVNPPSFGFEVWKDVFFPPQSILNQKIDVFRGAFMVFMPPEGSTVSVSSQDSVFGFLDHYWFEIQVCGEVERPEKLQIQVESGFQGFTWFQIPHGFPISLGISPKVLEDPNPVDGYSPQNVGNPFDAGQWLHGVLPFCKRVSRPWKNFNGFLPSL